jgi:hypothetical protein
VIVVVDLGVGVLKMRFVGVSISGPKEGDGDGLAWDVDASVGMAGENTDVGVLDGVGGGKVFSTISGAAGVRELQAVTQNSIKKHPTCTHHFWNLFLSISIFLLEPFPIHLNLPI